MDYLTSLVPFQIRQWISSISGSIQKQEVSNVFAACFVCCTKSSQFIIFADAERGVDDLVVTFCRNRFYDQATATVVKAGWSCRELDRIKLDRLRQEARNNQRYITYHNLSDPRSVFE
ncbi:uncharacterized protein BO80DRAFT_451864 [Aspergillus ibericus CBS 121593]|uniref:Uncharacterized protein n=1 Tax=Aspergillus ibericus CBS 121593 TaxID=1448316 RepID=A0A395HB22_9EURO|nr:hypothetical protein BO80DRAFT_451864 [Aspergillus ibericus CBS 121593]RAL04890.1 hypothetical protein BO80DRAFT_451864 [Aspergillus ibericus CBS 121593]